MLTPQAPRVTSTSDAGGWWVFTFPPAISAMSMPRAWPTGNHSRRLDSGQHQQHPGHQWLLGHRQHCNRYVGFRRHWPHHIVQLSSALPAGLPARQYWSNGAGNNHATPYPAVSRAGFVFVGSDNVDSYTHGLHGVPAASDQQQSSTAITGLEHHSMPPPRPTGCAWGVNASGVVQNGGLGFAGTFDGFGNTINNLTVSVVSATYAGLFGYNSEHDQEPGRGRRLCLRCWRDLCRRRGWPTTRATSTASSPRRRSISSGSSGAWAGGLAGYSNSGNS